jgi:hypothetical protein
VKGMLYELLLFLPKTEVGNYLYAGEGWDHSKMTVGRKALRKITIIQNY